MRLTAFLLVLAGCATADLKQRAVLGSGIALASAGTALIAAGVFAGSYQPPEQQAACAREPATSDGCLADGFARFHGVGLPMIGVGAAATLSGLALTIWGATRKKN